MHEAKEKATLGEDKHSLKLKSIYLISSKSLILTLREDLTVPSLL